ncbi:hypothetical protein F5878DRAFT_659171 [Lentinula raphanica]|uniref:Uncharacterized protein n=1 Tax=Lentinula raphanica TaxID=153919 RepID=A0AA38PD27_9AGAR|nr:hypothetical protein F5878DRAFT_659171 [Lentinula raphanica]
MFINSFLSTLLIMTHLSVVTGTPLPPVIGKAENSPHPSIETEQIDSPASVRAPPTIKMEQNDTPVRTPPTTRIEREHGQAPAYPPLLDAKGEPFSEDRLFELRIQEGPEGPVLYYSDTQGFRPFINEESHPPSNENWPWDLEDVTSPRETVLQLKIVAVFVLRKDERINAAIGILRHTLFQAEHHFVQVAVQNSYSGYCLQWPRYRNKEWERVSRLNQLAEEDRTRWKNGKYKELLEKYVEIAEREKEALVLKDPRHIWWKLQKLIWNNCMPRLQDFDHKSLDWLASKGRECLTQPIEVRTQKGYFVQGLRLDV